MISFSDAKLTRGQHIIPYRSEHLLQIEMRDYEAQNYEGHIEEYLEYVDMNVVEGLTWTAIGHGKVIGIFGFRPMWRAVGETWLLPGHGIERHAISVVRVARQIMTNVMYDFSLKRLQIAVSTQNDTAYRYAKSLYFEEEAIMKNYGPEGADYRLMVRLS
jgi:hypothetical protein